MATASPNAAAPSAAFSRFWVKFYRLRAAARRGWWILAICISVGLAYQAWKVYQLPQLWQSLTQLNIREELNVDQERARFSVDGQVFTATTLELLKSQEVVDRARKQMELKEPNLHGSVPEIVTSVVPRSYIFTVTGKGTNGEYTQRFVDMVVQSYIDFRYEQRNGTINTYLSSNTEQVKLVEAELAKNEAIFQDFVSKNNMNYWTERQRRDVEYLNGLKNKQASLQSELQRLETLSPEQLMAGPTPSGGSGANSAAQGANGSGGEPMEQNLYSAYLAKMQEVAQIKARLDERGRVWKQRHPKLQALQRQVTEAQGTLDLIRQQSVDSSRQRVDSIRATLKLLKTELEEYELQIAEASNKDDQYKRLQGEVTRTKETLDKMRVNNASLKTGARMDVFSVIKPATEPEEVGKNTLKHLIMGLVGGMALGVGIIVLRDRVDDRMSSSSEMLEQFNEPILGQIPNVDSSRVSNALPLLQPDDERYAFVEAYRSLRSSLIFMPNPTELRTLLVTSAIPNEGKSTISCNLAITMAAAGAKVILVDADLRRGDLAQLFELDGRIGLSSVLRSEVKWRDAIQETRYPTLTLLPRGPVSSQSSELLLLPSLEKLLEELKEEYDLVLFNTAPILATDDTPTLAPHFDGSLMVLRAQFTSARLTHNALNSLYQRQVNVLGLILNAVDTETPDYYYYRYPQYYAAQ